MDYNKEKADPLCQEDKTILVDDPCTIEASIDIILDGSCISDVCPDCFLPSSHNALHLEMNEETAVERYAGNLSDSDNSWDTMSDVSVPNQHLVHDKNMQPENVPGRVLQRWECMENIPPEVPVLCNIAHHMYCASNGKVELMVFGENGQGVSFSKEATEVTQEQAHPNSQHQSISPVDFSAQTALSDEEECSYSTPVISVQLRKLKYASNDTSKSKEESEQIEHLTPIWRSKSNADICSELQDSQKDCRTTVSCSEVNDNTCPETTILETIGDSSEQGIKQENDVKKDPLVVLEPYIHIEQSFAVSPPKKQVYECRVVSVEHLQANEARNTSAEGSNAHAEGVPAEPSNAERPSAAQVSENQEETDAAPDPSSLESPTEVSQAPSSMIASGETKSENRSDDQNSEAWVLLDSEGNTQEVTQGDVTILLGGRSADAVVAESTAHPMPNCTIHRPTRSDSSATTSHLEPIIRESLLLLKQDDSCAESPFPRRLNLERKQANMLLYIGMDMNHVPSVRFINLDTDVVHLWRSAHSRDNTRENCAVTSHSDVGNQEGSTAFGENYEEQIRQGGFHLNISKASKFSRNVSTLLSNTQVENTARQCNVPFTHIQSDTKSTTGDQSLNVQNTQDMQLEKGIIETAQKAAEEKLKCHENILRSVSWCRKSQTQIQELEEMQCNIQELKTLMIESENSVKEIIAKYIMDKSLEKELLKKMDAYSQSHIDGQQKMYDIVKNFVEDQKIRMRNYWVNCESEIDKIKKQNKCLDDENIQLLKRIEKLQIRMKQNDSTRECTLLQSDDVSTRNNEKLRNKLSATQGSLTEAETLCRELQGAVDNYTDEVRKLKLEIENQKLQRNRQSANHNIEITYLKDELNTSKRAMQESVDIADILIDDMCNFKKLFSETGKKFQINWDRLKVEGGTLVGVMNICRSYICELGHEILNVNQEQKLKEKEISMLKDNKCDLEKSLHELVNEHKNLQKYYEQIIGQKVSTEKTITRKYQENKELKGHLSEMSEHTTHLQKELDQLKKVTELAKRYQSMNIQLEKSIQELITEKQEMIYKITETERQSKSLEMKFFNMHAVLRMSEVKYIELVSLNHELSDEIDSLQRSLLLLQNYPEIYAELEKAYYKLLAENSYLKNEHTILKEEQNVFEKSQSEQSKQVQSLENHLKIMLKENDDLKSNLQEMMSKIQCLEYDNYNMLNQLEKETTKPGDPDVKLRELECIIVKKEVEIEDLQKLLKEQENTVNSLQRECVNKSEEKSELQIKYSDLLNKCKKGEDEILFLREQIREFEANISAVENEKEGAVISVWHEFESMETALTLTQEDCNATKCALDENKNILTFTENKLKEMEYKLMEKQNEIYRLQEIVREDSQMRENYLVMQEKLKDHDNIVLQRVQLVESQKEFFSEIENLHQILKKKQKKYDYLAKVCEEQSSQIEALEDQLRKVEGSLNESNTVCTEYRCLEYDLTEATSKLLHYEKHTSHLEKEVEKYKTMVQKETQIAREERGRLVAQLSELRAACQKDRYDSDVAAKNAQDNEYKVKELKSLLSEEIEKRKSAENVMKCTTQRQASLIAETEELQKRVKEAHENFQQIQREYEEYEQNVLKRESEFTSTLKKQDEKILSFQQENLQLQEEIKNLNKKILDLKDRNNLLEFRLSDHGRSISELQQEKRKNGMLENKLQLLTLEYNKFKVLGSFLEKQNSELSITVENSKKELEKTKSALYCIEKLEKERSETLRELENIKLQHSSEKNQLLQEMKVIHSDKIQIECSANELTKTKDDLEKKHRDLSEKLARAVQAAFEERFQLQSAQLQIRELSSEISNLKSEKITKQEQVKTMTTEIENLKLQVAQINFEKGTKENSDIPQQQSSSFQSGIQSMQTQLLKQRHKYKTEIQRKEEIILIKESTILQQTEQMQLYQNKIDRLTKQQAEIQEKLLEKQREHGRMQQNIISLQADKRKLSLELQQMEGLLKEERQKKH